MNKVVFLETSTDISLTLLMEDGELRYAKALPRGYRNSALLLPEVQKGLQSLGWKASDIDYVALGIGPGSYTGLRVAAALAKGLALPRRLPLIPVCSLRGFCADVEGPFVVLADARVSGAYVLHGENTRGSYVFDSEPTVMPLDVLAAKLPQDAHVVTPVGDGLKEKFASRAEAKGWTWEEKPMDSELLAKEVHCALQQRNVVSAADLQLLYLRKTQAELAIAQ